MTEEEDPEELAEYQQWLEETWEIKDETGLTQLHIAVYRLEHEKVDDLLSSDKADLSALTPLGLPPIHLLFIPPQPVEKEYGETRDNRYMRVPLSELTEKVLKVMRVLVSHGADVNQPTASGGHITEYNCYWSLTPPFHQLMIKQNLLLPDMGAITNRETDAVSYTCMRDHIHYYLQAGSRCPFAIRSVVAMNSLKWDMAELELAYHASSQQYREIGMGWLFQNDLFEEMEKLEWGIQCFIYYIYRVSDGPYYADRSKIADDHGFWKHDTNRRNPLSLMYCCVEIIRVEMFKASLGYSIIPRLKHLPVPEKVQDLLELKIEEKPEDN